MLVSGDECPQALTSSQFTEECSAYLPTAESNANTPTTTAITGKGGSVAGMEGISTPILRRRLPPDAVLSHAPSNGSHRCHCIGCICNHCFASAPSTPCALRVSSHQAKSPRRWGPPLCRCVDPFLFFFSPLSAGNCTRSRWRASRSWFSRSLFPALVLMRSARAALRCGQPPVCAFAWECQWLRVELRLACPDFES